MWCRALARLKLKWFPNPAVAFLPHTGLGELNLANCVRITYPAQQPANTGNAAMGQQQAGLGSDANSFAPPHPDFNLDDLPTTANAFRIILERYMPDITPSVDQAIGNRRAKEYLRHFDIARNERDLVALLHACIESLVPFNGIGQRVIKEAKDRHRRLACYILAYLGECSFGEICCC